MLAAAAMLIAGTASAQTIAPGKHEYSVELPGTRLNVFTSGDHRRQVATPA